MLDTEKKREPWRCDHWFIDFLYLTVAGDHPCDIRPGGSFSFFEIFVSNTDIPLLFKLSDLLVRSTIPSVTILVLRRFPGGASSELRRLLFFKEEGVAIPGGPYFELLFDNGVETCS